MILVTCASRTMPAHTSLMIRKQATVQQMQIGTEYRQVFFGEHYPLPRDVDQYEIYDNSRTESQNLGMHDKHTMFFVTKIKEGVMVVKSCNCIKSFAVFFTCDTKI